MNAFDVVVYVFAGFGVVSLVGISVLAVLFMALTSGDDGDYSRPPDSAS